MLKTLEYEYAIYPHKNNWEKGQVYVEAEKFNIPLCPVQVIGGNAGTLPLKRGFLSIHSENLILSAFKKAEDRESYIIRVFNPTNETINGDIKFSSVLTKAFLTDMNETRKESLDIVDNRIQFEVGANKIVTLELISNEKED